MRLSIPYHRNLPEVNDPVTGGGAGPTSGVVSSRLWNEVLLSEPAAILCSGVAIRARQRVIIFCYSLGPAERTGDYDGQARWLVLTSKGHPC